MAQTQKIRRALEKAEGWLGRAHCEGVHEKTVAPNDLMATIKLVDAVLTEIGRTPR